MSIPIFAWAIEAGRVHQLCAEDRCLLMVLANMANGHLFCWPMQATLMADTGLPKRSLIRAIQRLEGAGLIRSEPRGKSRTYYILRDDVTGARVAPNGVGTSATVAPVRPRKSATVAPVEAEQVPNLHPTGAKSAQNKCQGGTQNLKRNQEEEPRKEERTPLPPAGGGSARINHPDFATFWELYPRRVGKRTAEDAFGAAVKRAGSSGAILDGLRAQTFSDDPQYIPHPTTWLRGDRWTDEPMPAAKPKPTLAQEWGLKSFLTPNFDDDDDLTLPPGRLLS